MEIIGAQGALPLEPRPAGGPGRGLDSWKLQNPQRHDVEAMFRRKAFSGS